METNLLFENEKERDATERVLAAFKAKSLNETIDELISDILKYAKEMDDLLEGINLERRFLDRASSLSEHETLSLDEDLNDVDFRVREVLEDLLKRINTRINLIKENDKLLKTIEESYELSNLDLDEEIKVAKLTEENFV